MPLDPRALRAHYSQFLSVPAGAPRRILLTGHSHQAWPDVARAGQDLAFVDAAAYGQLTTKSKAEVAGAQFNALQFGRVGAPRNWIGDKGQSGAVMVGPYVRVNLIDCRDFTNTVTIGGQTFTKKGTACREADGSWTVTATKTG